MMGAPGEAAFEPLRPWLVSVTFSVAPLMKAGNDPKSGVDLKLKNLFTRAHKPIGGFETLQQQLHFFAVMPTGLQVADLESTLRQMDTAQQSLDSLWPHGRTETSTRLLRHAIRDEWAHNKGNVLDPPHEPEFRIGQTN